MKTGHNRGPSAAHLAALQAARARVLAQLEELEASARIEIRKFLQHWRGYEGSMRFAPSRLMKCPRDRALLAEAQRVARAQADAKRAAQVGWLRSKLARIERQL